MKTAEEIAIKYLVIDELPRNPEKHGADIFFWSDIISAMEAYAAQFKEQKPTDEEMSQRSLSYNSQRDLLIAFACYLNSVPIEQYKTYYTTKVDRFLKTMK